MIANPSHQCRHSRSWNKCAGYVRQGRGQHGWDTLRSSLSAAESIADLTPADGLTHLSLPQKTRINNGKQWVRPAAVPSIMSPHYLDSSLHELSASWPEVGRRVLQLLPDTNPLPCVSRRRLG